MAMPSSGEIKFSQLQAEYGGSNPIALSEYYGKGNAPASGEIQLAADFYGTSNSVSVEFRLYGGEGGGNTSGLGSAEGGQGGYTNWQGLMSPGTQLTVYVGGGGQSSNSDRGGAGGGGGSAIFISSTIICVAGGGGGAGSAYTQKGGDGGGSTGQDSAGTNHAGFAEGGFGGSQTSGGRQATGSRGNGVAATNQNGSQGGRSTDFWKAGGFGYGNGGAGSYLGGDGGNGGGGGGWFGGSCGAYHASGTGGGGGSGYLRTAGLPSGVSYTSGSNNQGGNYTSGNGTGKNGYIEIYVGGSLQATKSYTGGIQYHTIS